MSIEPCRPIDSSTRFVCTVRCRALLMRARSAFRFLAPPADPAGRITRNRAHTHPSCTCTCCACALRSAELARRTRERGQRRVDARGADECEGIGGKRAEGERYAHGGDCAMHLERYLARPSCTIGHKSRNTLSRLHARTRSKIQWHPSCAPTPSHLGHGRVGTRRKTCLHRERRNTTVHKG